MAQFAAGMQPSVSAKRSAFFTLTPEIADVLRSLKLTAAAWRLWSYLIVLDPFGDRYRTLPAIEDVLRECAMSKPTFYRAIATFEEAGLFDFLPIRFSFKNLFGSKSISKRDSLKNDTAVSELIDESQECDEVIISETSLSKLILPIAETDAVKGFQNPHDSTDFKDSSDSLNPPQAKTRERIDLESDADFREWLREKGFKLPNPPQFMEMWIDKQARKWGNKREFLQVQAAKVKEETATPAASPAPNRFQVESACIAAYQQGDRPFLVAKLQQLWADGWHHLVESLCLAYPVWNLRSSSGGVMEGL